MISCWVFNLLKFIPGRGILVCLYSKAGTRIIVQNSQGSSLELASGLEFEIDLSSRESYVTTVGGLSNAYFSMSCFRLPKTFPIELNAIIARFWWVIWVINGSFIESVMKPFVFLRKTRD